MRIFHLLLATSLFVAFACFARPSMAADSAIRLTNVAELEIEVVGKDGKKMLKRTPVQKAIPAIEVIYTTTFENVANKPVGNIVINNPIPNDSEYRAGSAFGRDCEILFSADGGKLFAKADKLNVKAVDGKERAALPREYTHIRWTYQGQLMAGKSGEVGFRTVIK
jgi:uncharacterized repeat protein (TIGR01451 family)